MSKLTPELLVAAYHKALFPNPFCGVFDGKPCRFVPTGFFSTPSPQGAWWWVQFDDYETYSPGRSKVIRATELPQ